MITKVYLIRCSEKIKSSLFSEDNTDMPEREKDMQKVLSVSGEVKAQNLFKSPMFDNVSVIYSSPYARAIGTAKYLANRLDLKINIEKKLEKRKYGDLDNKHNNSFYYNQFHDFDYKLSGGEAINDLKRRIVEVFDSIVFTHYEKEIVIVTHIDAIIAFLTNYCDIGYNLEDDLVMSYGRTNFTTSFDNPDGIVVTLEDSKVVEIARI